MELYDTIKYLEYINNKNKLEQQQKIEEYKMQIILYHTAEPQKILEELDNNAEQNKIKNLIGDLDKLQKYKNRG